MKKLVIVNILLAAFLLVTNPVLAADNEDLDVTMQVMGAGDLNQEKIMNQIKLPEETQAKTRTRTQTRVMDGEQNGDMNQIRTQTRTEEMEKLREASRDQMHEQRREIIMDISEPVSPGGVR
ncbi:MAG: hypothetical protein KAS94_02685 [Desulfobulbaceae bacterium]|nr:hypothetical protein [Desulfobulbaceae bacterium]